MNPPSAIEALRCEDCGDALDPDETAGCCPGCGGPLVAQYDLAAVELSLDPGATGATARFLDRTGLAALVGPAAGQLASGGHGETPLVATPGLAADLGVATVAVKDEGCNPTGASADRELAVAVGAASACGATAVALPTMGNGGQAAAAAAARAGMDSHSFVPSRTPFVNKAMINVHGGEMSVVEGRYRDARAAFADEIADADWATLAPFETPYRQEGAKPIAYEIAAARDWTVPDAVVVPTGQVTGLVGIHRGFRELADLGITGRVPRIVAAEAAGCAPLSAARAEGTSEPVAVDHPDTVCGQLEIPDPAGGWLALEAIDRTGGAAIASDDESIFEGARTLAEAGGPTSVTGGAAVPAARALADRGTVDADADVVLVNPVSANKEADLMRSHLMSLGR